MNYLSKNQVVQLLNMQPHPEGGYYAESFRSKQSIETEIGTRCASTAIYFLLGHNDTSKFHKIKSDEVWHYYAGETLSIVELDNERKISKTTKLGPNLLNGEVLQYVVPANTWFGSYLPEPHAPGEGVHVNVNIPAPNPNTSSGYTLVGCTVAPGFEFQDFEMAKRDELIQEFPQAIDIINRLTENVTDIKKLHTYKANE
jgi:predicted cupin superfamily sugar epimerase